MTSADPALRSTLPLREIGRRLSILWVRKMLATLLGMTGFFIAYFWVLHHPINPVVTMPLTGIDRALIFRPAALPIYLSLWFYVSLAPALMTDRRTLLLYGLIALALSVCGLTIFYLFPTQVPTAGIDWARHPSFLFLKSIDASGNACPSLHVAFAVFTAFGFQRVLREMQMRAWCRGLNWLWCLGIAYSTIAIRQHVFLDVAAGALLGLLAGVVFLRVSPSAPAGTH